MNKRAFIKFFAAAMAIPAVSRLLVWAGGERLKNWAGNLEYSTDRLYTPTSREHVRDYVRKETRLKVLGTPHCFNNIADSKDSFLS
jgi:alditol oxidase